ncbi:MAG: S4 domain-containing protein [Puniceicoccaceae bacterium]
MDSEGMRLDRYLWHVRLCKTRSQATQACRSGEVRIGGDRVKPSRLVKPGQEFQMRRAGANRSYRILASVEHRVSAKEVPSLLLETTPQEVLDVLQAAREAPALRRDRGMGRPTKRDLRLIEKLMSGSEC